MVYPTAKRARMRPSRSIRRKWSGDPFHDAFPLRAFYKVRGGKLVKWIGRKTALKLRRSDIIYRAYRMKLLDDVHFLQIRRFITVFESETCALPPSRRHAIRFFTVEWSNLVTIFYLDNDSFKLNWCNAIFFSKPRNAGALTTFKLWFFCFQKCQKTFPL